MQVNILEAKTQLSRLVKAARAGEEVIIARDGVPAVRLVPVDAVPAARQPGAWSGLPPADPDWDSAIFDRQIAESLFGDPDS